jgi:predicted CXXCH cytochrome family protein
MRRQSARKHTAVEHLDVDVVKVPHNDGQNSIVSKDQSIIKSESFCAECHDAHATNQQFLLKKPDPELCSRCHLNLTAGKRFVHEPVLLSCTLCHDPHASDNASDLHVPVNELCLGCYGENAEKITYSRRPLSLFEGRVSLPLKYFEKKMKPLRLSPDGLTGHPTEGHPVYVPADGNKPELNCLSCHFPHADASSPQLLREGKDTLCLRCHKM